MNTTDLIVPSSTDVIRELDSPTVYALEQAGGVAREVLDDRIVRWTEDRWTQQQIADEIGLDPGNLSRRMQRMERDGLLDPRRVKSTNRGRPRNIVDDNIPVGDAVVIDELEPVDGEIVDLGLADADEDLAMGYTRPAAEVFDRITEVVPMSRSTTIAGVQFPAGGIADNWDVTKYTTADLKHVSDDLIRRATPQEAAALTFGQCELAREHGMDFFVSPDPLAPDVWAEWVSTESGKRRHHRANVRSVADDGSKVKEQAFMVILGTDTAKKQLLKSFPKQGMNFVLTNHTSRGNNFASSATARPGETEEDVDARMKAQYKRAQELAELRAGGLADPPKPRKRVARARFGKRDLSR